MVQGNGVSFRRAPILHQTREQQSPPQRSDRGQTVETAIQIGRLDFFIHIRKRNDAGQQGGAIQRFRKSIPQGARGAAGRNQDQRVGERKRSFARSFKHTGA